MLLASVSTGITEKVSFFVTHRSTRTRWSPPAPFSSRSSSCNRSLLRRVLPLGTPCGTFAVLVSIAVLLLLLYSSIVYPPSPSFFFLPAGSTFTFLRACHIFLSPITRSVEGYVMDSYCINLGVLLDTPSIKTFEGPGEHSFHWQVIVVTERGSYKYDGLGSSSLTKPQLPF